MQWTVRYFTYKGELWRNMHETVTTEDSNVIADHIIGAGAAAYAKRKQSTWDHMALKSDRSFKYINSAYKSPLS